jgi:hypothetical protein
MDLLIIGFYGISYMVFMFGFLTLYRKLRKQPVSYRSLFTQSFIGGTIFMLLLTLFGGNQ